ncbi:MAG TPA: glycosyltransferase [Thermoanaerobaculia bacterium]|nr:glycosyltransferase [Thermoanaerobaculia bacterium]
MPESPAVTVLMAVRNPGADFFRQAVESVLSQTFDDFELIIVQDPSQVPVEEILAGISDSRIRVHRNESQVGLAQSLNIGLALARGALIARIDSDDLCLPQRLERQVAFLAEHPEIDVYGSRIIVIDDKGKAVGRRLLPLSHEEIAVRMRRTNCVSHPSVMFRRASVERVGGYEANQVVEDFELWCRMLTRGARFAASAEPLILYRFHEGALKFSLARPTITNMREIKLRYFRGQLGFLDRLRLFAERLLLFLPSRVVIFLFKLIEYRRS